VTRSNIRVIPETYRTPRTLSKITKRYSLDQSNLEESDLQGSEVANGYKQWYRESE
jgi:hypothetical protein